MVINYIEQCKKKKKRFAIKSEIYCEGQKKKVAEVLVMLRDLGQNSSVVETVMVACSDMSSKQERIICGHHILYGYYSSSSWEEERFSQSSL